MRSCLWDAVRPYNAERWEHKQQKGQCRRSPCHPHLVHGHDVGRQAAWCLYLNCLLVLKILQLLLVRL